MIVLELTESMFSDAFHRIGRGTQFSYLALLALYDHLEDLHSDADPYSLDVIELCCDWSEETLEEIVKNYPDVETLADLQNTTTAIELNNGHILYLTY